MQVEFVAPTKDPGESMAVAIPQSVLVYPKVPFTRGHTLIAATSGVWRELSLKVVAQHLLLSNPDTSAFTVVLEARSRCKSGIELTDLSAVVVKALYPESELE